VSSLRGDGSKVKLSRIILKGARVLMRGGKGYVDS